jgi:hypothetical protein
MGVINEDEQPTAGMFADAYQALNSLIKEWEALGIHIWTEQEAILFTQLGQSRYLLGGTTADHTTDAYGYVLMQLTASSAAGSHTITVDSIVGVLNGMTIGVTLDSGVVQWTTVNGAPSGSTVTITAALAGASSTGSFAFAYVTGSEIQRPLKIPAARRLAYQGVLETPLIEFSRREYMDLPIKNNPGVPTAFFYNPARDQGEIFIWPTPNAAAQSAIRFTWYRSIQDIVTVANTIDFPQEWINALTWNLAVEMAADYSLPPQRLQWLKMTAEEKLELVRGWDREAQPIYFQMNYDQMRR